MNELVIVFLISFAITLVCTPSLIRKFRNANIVGEDVNKADKPKIPEMGGTMVVMGLVGGVMTAVFLNITGWLLIWSLKF